MEYTQPLPTIIPKTGFTEVFFAPQGDSALIPPVSGRESYYHASPAPVSQFATIDPRPVPQDLYFKVLQSGYAELPVGPGADGFYPSARDLVATVKHVQRGPVAAMAKRIRNFMKTLAEKDSVIKELETTLANPDLAAQTTDIGALKGSNEYLEDWIRTIIDHRESERERHESELKELQADIKTANEDRQRAEARFATYERQIAAKDKTIAGLRAAPKGARDNGTIVSPTDESGSTSRITSLSVWQEMAAKNEITITQLQNQIIELRTKDMTKTDADLLDRTLRAEYASDKLKDEIKNLQTEVDEQRSTINLYEERLQDQEAHIQRLQLEKAQQVQEIRAAEKKTAEYNSRELNLIKDKTNLGNRVKVLNEQLKDRLKELKESDQQLTLVHTEHATTLNESARLKDEIQKVTHERTMLKRSLAQAGDWQQEKYTASLSSEEVKQELAALRESTARMADKHRVQLQTLEVVTREKLKNERMEARRKRRKVQEELVALRGRALTNPSEAESEQVSIASGSRFSQHYTDVLYTADMVEDSSSYGRKYANPYQDPDSATAVNAGRSLEEELNGSSGSEESSPVEEATGIFPDAGTHTQAFPDTTQGRPSQNRQPHLSKSSKYSEYNLAPQLEDDVISSADDKTPNETWRSRSRPVVGFNRPGFTQDKEIYRVRGSDIDGAMRLGGDRTDSPQSILEFDNEVQHERESNVQPQRLPNFETPLRPEGGSETAQQRLPNLNEQGLQEGGFSTRRRRPPILISNVPILSDPRKPARTRQDMDDQERPSNTSGGFRGTDWINSLIPSQEHQETPSPSGPPAPPPDEAGTQTGGQLMGTDWKNSMIPSQEHQATANPSDPLAPPSNEAGTQTGGQTPGSAWVDSLRPSQDHQEIPFLSGPPSPPPKEAGTQIGGKIIGTNWFESLRPSEDHQEAPTPSGPPVQPSETASTQTTGKIIGTGWIQSLRVPQEQPEAANQDSDGQGRPKEATGGLFGTPWVESLIPPQEHQESPDPSGPPGPPSAEASAGDRKPPSSSLSGSDTTPRGGNGGGRGRGRGGGGGGDGSPRNRRPRAPVLIPVVKRVRYEDGYQCGKWLGRWESLAWALVALFLLGLFLMFMSLRTERQRWLAANEGTRQMLFSLQRGGPVGTRLLTWLLDNAFLNVETTSYG